MFIELVDALRCPRTHEGSWLVASVGRMDGRDIVTGVLGCPVCRSEFVVVNGIVNFGNTRSREETGGPSTAPGVAPPDAEGALRLAAFLHLIEEGGYAVLYGAWAAYASVLEQMAPTHLLLVNPPPGLRMGSGTSGIGVDDGFPLAEGSARGVALDGSVNSILVRSAVRALAPQARMVAPVSLPMPEGIHELTRDASVWVGEREAETGTTGTPVRLLRAPR